MGHWEQEEQKLQDEEQGMMAVRAAVQTGGLNTGLYATFKPLPKFWTVTAFLE